MYATCLASNLYVWPRECLAARWMRVYRADRQKPMRQTGVILVLNMRTAAYSNGYGSDRLPSRYYILPREITAVTGISENGKTAYSVYPNPTSDNITLNVSGDATHAILYNVMGMQVANQTVTVGANTVNMSQLPAGVYFLRIFNGNETAATLKVVRR